MSREMIRSRFRASLIILFACAVLVPLTNPLLGNVNAESITFSHTPSGYNNQTGAFTMGSQLTDDAGNGGVCVMYDYFIFNAQAGLTLQGQVQAGSTGRMIYYLILNSPYELYSFQNSNCGFGNWEPVQGFSSATTINWVPTKDGQYTLVFLVNGFYSGPVYFTQSSG